MYNQNNFFDAHYGRFTPSYGTKRPLARGKTATVGILP